MAIVYCYNKRCKYRNKKSSKALNKGGNRMHKCMCKELVIQSHISGFDETLVEENIVSCLNFEKDESFE